MKYLTHQIIWHRWFYVVSLSQVVSLQEEVEPLESDLQERQQQIHTVQLQAEQANELAKVNPFIHFIFVCLSLQEKITSTKQIILYILISNSVSTLFVHGIISLDWCSLFKRRKRRVKYKHHFQQM